MSALVIQDPLWTDLTQSLHVYSTCSDKLQYCVFTCLGGKFPIAELHTRVYGMRITCSTTTHMLTDSVTVYQLLFYLQSTLVVNFAHN